MKNLALLLAIFATIQLQAQDLIGIKGAYQYSNITIDGVADLLPNPDHMDNFQVGVFAHFPIASGFGFQPELLLSQKGFVVQESFDVDIFDFDVPFGAEARTRIKYVEAPLLIKYTNQDHSVHFFIEAGPVFGYAVDADVRTRLNAIVDINIADTDINLDNDIYNRWEAGGLIGAGIGIPIGRTTLQAGLRYQHSFSDLLNDPIIDVRGRNYGISGQVGLAFKI
jgi:hypothetical protein